MGETKFPVPIKGPARSTTWEISELLLNYSHEAIDANFTLFRAIVILGANVHRLRFCTLSCLENQWCIHSVDCKVLLNTKYASAKPKSDTQHCKEVNSEEFCILHCSCMPWRRRLIVLSVIET